MRRHVEDPKENLGIILLSLLWLIAVFALSASAQGQQITSTANQQNGKAVHSSHASAETHISRQESTTTRFILVSIPDRLLAFVDDGQVVKTYKVAVGADKTPSPSGIFTVINQAKDPVYIHEGKVIAPGKGNPVGTRWLGLSIKGYGIHGTNIPSSIGKAASHGCIRMKQKDIEELYALIKVGDVVAIRGDRDELVAQVFDRESDLAPMNDRHASAKNAASPALASVNPETASGNSEAQAAPVQVAAIPAAQVAGQE